METLMPISYLNDFIFCPYSIYLHQVFDQTKHDVYSALPQQRGRAAHKEYEENESEVFSEKEEREIYIISTKLGIFGKIDSYIGSEKRLVERKYFISVIYQGYYFQLWAQYFALVEMGFEVKELSFFSIKDQKTYLVPLPGENEWEMLRSHIRRIARFDFDAELKINPIKCKHCIYAALCDKSITDHVYA